MILLNRTYCHRLKDVEEIFTVLHNFQEYVRSDDDYVFKQDARGKTTFFQVYKIAAMSNSFNPIFCGKIEKDAEGYLLSGKIKPHILVRIFFIFMLVQSLLNVLINLFLYGFSMYNLNNILDCLMLLATFVAFYSIGSLTQMRKRKQIREIVKNVCENEEACKPTSLKF